MKRLYILFLISGLLITGQLPAQQLRVSENGRYLTYSDGKPFFYLGDTGWDLFRQLDREEAVLYLENRAEKGFTVIQAVVIFGHEDIDHPNAFGETPLIDQDPTKPNEAYFKHVDFVVDRAEELGLFMGILPTWGSYWGGNDPESIVFTPENAYIYGEFLGKRYRNKPIIWILGGDENIKSQREYEIIESMAMGLKKGDEGNHLITFHPRGPGLSSDYFQDAEWIDFNMYQSSHAAHDHDNGLYAEHDYQLTPVKPTLDGEPRYELIQASFYFRGYNRLDLFDAYDCRQAAYWSLLAGACGHTYGHNCIFQFWEPGKPGYFGASISWQEAMDHPGAFQMGLVRKLFETRPWQKLKPAQHFLLTAPDTGGAKVRAAMADDGSFVFVYSPMGEPFTVDKGLMNYESAREVWYDPRYGMFHRIHGTHTRGIQTYSPPTHGRGNDWILIIEDEDMYPEPGSGSK